MLSVKKKYEEEKRFTIAKLDIYAMNDFVKEYLETQRLEAEYECRTAHKAIKRGATSYNEYEQGYEEEEEQ